MENARIPGWMRTVPPLRWKPRPQRRRRHHTSLHHAYHEPVETAVFAVGRDAQGLTAASIQASAWMLAITVWMVEVELWCMAWMLYGTYYLPTRWIYKHNLIGRAVAAVTPGPAPAPYDPHGAPARPIDLATLGGDSDPWDTGDMRRRS